MDSRSSVVPEPLELRVWAGRIYRRAYLHRMAASIISASSSATEQDTEAGCLPSGRCAISAFAAARCSIRSLYPRFRKVLGEGSSGCCTA